MTTPIHCASVMTCLILSFGTLGCSSFTGTVSAPASPYHPPPLTEAQSQEVVRILEKTDALDRMIRSDTKPGYSELALKVEREYMLCQQKLPPYKTNLARDCFMEIVGYYGDIRLFYDGNLKKLNNTPVELMAQAVLRKRLLISLLKGKGTEREWQALLDVVATGKNYR